MYCIALRNIAGLIKASSLPSLMNVSKYALSDRHEVLFVPTSYQIIATIIKGYSQEASECALVHLLRLLSRII